ncbi:MAG: hypothetical protein WCO90_12090 [Planctomycetota bacterium]
MSDRAIVDTIAWIPVEAMTPKAIRVAIALQGVGSSGRKAFVRPSMAMPMVIQKIA